MIVQGPCTYIVNQSALEGWTTETVYGKRRWLPFREQGALNITPFFERHTERVQVAVLRTAIDVACYVYGGKITTRYRHQGIGAQDGLQTFLDTLDRGVYQLGSVSGVSTEPPDHIGWLSDEALAAYGRPIRVD